MYQGHFEDGSSEQQKVHKEALMLELGAEPAELVFSSQGRDSPPSVSFGDHRDASSVPAAQTSDAFHFVFARPKLRLRALTRSVCDIAQG